MIFHLLANIFSDCFIHTAISLIAFILQRCDYHGVHSLELKTADFAQKYIFLSANAVIPDIYLFNIYD